MGYKWGMRAIYDSNGALRGRISNVKIRRDDKRRDNEITPRSLLWNG
jgi:hypothetical protein